MESKALREYKGPDYPRKEQVQDQPSLLHKSVERRWQKLYDLGISGMLVAGLSLSGCDKKPATNTTAAQGIDATSNKNPNAGQTNNVSPAKVAALVAPIFEHGDGRGAIGCVVMTPPAFLSEEEALVVIKDELSKHGILFNKEKILLNEVSILPPKEAEFESLIKVLPYLDMIEGKPTPLEIDLQNSEKVINVEYICKEEFDKYDGARISSTVSSYNTKKNAMHVRDQIQLVAKEGIFGVFYDPMPDLVRRRITHPAYNEQGELIPRKPNEESVNLLREQVQDFAQWLKEQGVIK